MTSIRGKIALSYYLLAAVAVGFALFAYGDLHYLERRIKDGEVVYAFREVTAEMRRHEKNHLLYGDLADLDLARQSARAAHARLDRREIFSALAGPASPAEVGANLERYTGLIDRYQAAAADPLLREALAQELRATGHAISEQAEALGKREREMLAATTQQSQWAMFISMGVLVLLGLLIGQLLSRAAVRPLRRLEAELQSIAEGRFAAFHRVSEDREMVSLTDALNRMLAELEDHRRQVLQSEKLASLGVLASGVAHELNNPLGNISSSCQILLEELGVAGPEQQREWLEQIDAEAERGRRIVRTLLDYSRRGSFQIQRLALEEVLHKCLVLMRNEIAGRQAVRFDIPAELVVCGDEQHLQQVFINLIKNALDAGGPQVQVTVGAAVTSWHQAKPPHDAHVVGEIQLCGREDCPLVRIVVQDNGPGIASDNLAKVFDPFFTTRGPGKGVGLGLYVVEEIVLEHGGCIAVENPAEGGCRFTIWLPCRGEERIHD